MTEPVKRISDGELWSFLRSVLEQGRAIEQDNAAGVYVRREQLSARIDVAASERVEEWNRRATGQTERDAVIEECAKVCDALAKDYHANSDFHQQRSSLLLAKRIRSLASTPPEKKP